MHDTLHFAALVLYRLRVEYVDCIESWLIRDDNDGSDYYDHEDDDDEDHDDYYNDDNYEGDEENDDDDDIMMISALDYNADDEGVDENDDDVRQKDHYVYGYETKAGK